jgi:23S rRNA (pseudouridine1915-N3)-methyltransferase
MKLRVVVVGKDRNDPLLQAGDDYLERLNHYFPTELVSVKEEPARTKADLERVKKLEAERLVKAAGKAVVLVVLDENGTTIRSEELANRLGRWADEGRQEIAFLVGGPNGVSDELRRQAAFVLSLSKMTLPHRLARVVLLEQLYRAVTILRGEPYHK